MGKLNPSWEKTRSEVHSPNGVKALRQNLKTALIRKYSGMAENMWKYNFDEFGQFEDFLTMTRDDEPEKTLLRNGQGVWFETTEGQWAFLPVVFDAEINIYGNPVGWSPVPVGYNDSTDRGKSRVRDDIRDRKLDAGNSVLMKDNAFAQSDYALIESAVSALVDTMLTVNQLTLLAKSPFIFRVGQNNLNDAKNFFLALAEDCPAIFRYDDAGEDFTVTEQTGSAIDTALFDVYRQWENILLEQLGIPGSQVTQKRAQQSVDEVNLGDDMVSLRRKEKYRYRQAALDRLNEMAGTSVTVVSLIDSQEDEEEMDTSDNDNGNGDNENTEAVQ